MRQSSCGAVVGQGECPDEGAEMDYPAGEEAAEAACLRPMGGRPEGWYSIHGGMVEAHATSGRIVVESGRLHAGERYLARFVPAGTLATR